MFVSELSLRDPHHVFDQFKAGMVGSFALGFSSPAKVSPRVDGPILTVAKQRLWPELRGDEELTTDRSGHLVVFLSTSHPLLARRRMHGMIRALLRAPFATPDGRFHLDVGAAWTRLTGDEDSDDEHIRGIIDGATASLATRDVMRYVRRGPSGRGRAVSRAALAAVAVPRLTLAPREHRR